MNDYKSQLPATTHRVPMPPVKPPKGAGRGPSGIDIVRFSKIPETCQWYGCTSHATTELQGLNLSGAYYPAASVDSLVGELRAELEKSGREIAALELKITNFQFDEELIERRYYDR